MTPATSSLDGRSMRARARTSAREKTIAPAVTSAETRPFIRRPRVRRQRTSRDDGDARDEHDEPSLDALFGVAHGAFSRDGARGVLAGRAVHVDEARDVHPPRQRRRTSSGSSTGARTSGKRLYHHGHGEMLLQKI